MEPIEPVSLDSFGKLKEEAREGRIDLERLVELLGSALRLAQNLQNQLDAKQKELETAQKRSAELEKRLDGSPTTKVDQPYSTRAEEKRQEARAKKKKKAKTKKRRGRRTSQEKLKQAERTEPIYPKDVPPEQCKLSHTRPVWRLENGRAILVAYAIYRGPKKQYGQIPGVLGRSEFGLEIMVEIVHLVYVSHLSFDKVCAVLHFFQNLHLSKAQLDALLYRLARHWEREFDTLCTLLANSAVVHADETSWSIHSVWAFLSEKARLLLYGVHKDEATLKQILDPETFAGIVISDDAAVYANFSKAQKCWAHLLRKIFKLTLEAPTNPEYRTVADRLLEIYRRACRVQKDKRLSVAGRGRKVEMLDDAVLELCAPTWSLDLPPLAEGPANDFRKLVNELMRLMLAKELFTFVTAAAPVQPNGESKPVAGTNNLSERELRPSGLARDTGRTDKSVAGARRRSVLVSVLESLRLYLSSFTLKDVLEEVKRWWDSGQSCFTRLLRKCKLALPEKSLLEKLLPLSSG
jgi:regulator of protease activity HflC (stomatin/prohibitin superfamily)